MHDSNEAFVLSAQFLELVWQQASEHLLSFLDLEADTDEEIDTPLRETPSSVFSAPVNVCAFNFKAKAD